MRWISLAFTFAVGCAPSSEPSVGEPPDVAAFAGHRDGAMGASDVSEVVDQGLASDLSPPQDALLPSDGPISPDMAASDAERSPDAALDAVIPLDLAALDVEIPPDTAALDAEISPDMALDAMIPPDLAALDVEIPLDVTSDAMIPLDLATLDMEIPPDVALDVMIPPDMSPDSAPPPPPTLELEGGVRVEPGDPQPGDLITIHYSGALAFEARVGLHYGFNGWNEVAGVALTAEQDATSNTDFYAEAWMSPTAEGQALSLMLPEGARALHFVFFAGEDERAWDNNETRDYQLGLGRPLVGPVLTYEGVDPAEAIRLTAHTGGRCDGIIEYGPTAALGALAMTEDQRAHHVEIPRAGPLFYRFSCGGRVLTEITEVRAAPAAGAPLRFGVLGDAQARGELLLWPEVAASMAEAELDLVLAVGDLPWDDRPGLWWSFFDEARGLFASTPLLATVGNHDTPTTDSNEDTSSFERWFGIEATWRRVQVGDAAFLLLDSERVSTLAIDAAQHSWLAETLDAHEAPWTFVGLHHPPYNLGLRHYTQQGASRDVTGLLDGRADWVFAGHEHLYQRFKPMRYNAALAPSGRYGRGAEDGVGYLVVPAAGAWPEGAIIGPNHELARYRERLASVNLDEGQDQLPTQNGYVIVSLDPTTEALTLQVFGLGHPGSGLEPLSLIDEVVTSRAP